ncbi:MAG: hypothetical protein FJ125_05590, partial [Deltaproteobacteria bacterium]|nr:hypothetical protein [Deltaproteobacteria bacterium]
TLLASGPALAAPPLPRWLHPLTVQAVSWSGGTGMLTLERVGLTRREGDAGLAGQIARIEVALGDPDDRARVPALRSLRLLRPRLELDLAGFTGRTETARAADAGPAPAAGSGEPAAEGRLEQMVLRLVELLQLSSAPALARLDELAAEDGELRLTLAGEQVVLSRVEVQVRPPRSLELRAAASGPWESSADLSGELAWPRWQEGTLQLEGRLALSDGRLFHPPIAPQPIEQIEVRGRGRLVIHPATGELALEMGQLLVQGLQTSLAVRAQGIGTRPPDFSLTLGLPPQPCQQLADALPAGLAPLLEGMRLQGEMAGELHLALSLSRDEEKVRDLSLKGPGLESCAIRSLGKVRVEKLKDEFVHRIEIPDRSGKAPREVEVGPGTESYVNLQEIPAHVLKSMVVTENISFYEGGPISLGLVRGALNLNLTHQRYVYGGSTISQQLVKNLFLSRHKNLARKLQEAFIAWRMEELLGKDRILELYVNCIEFGPGIYGIEQAARYYFGHGARELSPVQGAFLAAIKPAPGEGPRTVRRGRLEGWVEERMTRAMASLEKDGLIDAAERQAAYPFQLTFRTGEERVAGQQQGQADPDEERDGPAGGTGEHRAHGR